MFNIVAEDGKIDPAIAMRQMDQVLDPLRKQLRSHRLYDQMMNVSDICRFVEHHVYAVWDFMALLKALQRHLTCTDSYWRPVWTGGIRRLINEMVLEEESDEIGGVATSHFEVYLNAMREAEADLSSIEGFMKQVRNGSDLDAVFVGCGVPAAARGFVRTTFGMIASEQPHVICAAFTFGREQALPCIFKAVLQAMSGAGDRLRPLKLYLERHIQLDGDEHGPKAVAMLVAVCGDDVRKWHEAIEAARSSLQARLDFWAGIAAELDRRRGCQSPNTSYMMAQAAA